MTLFLSIASPALAASDDSPPPFLVGETAVTSLPPVFAADGKLVLTIRQTPVLLDVVAVDPTDGTKQTIRKITIPNRTLPYGNPEMQIVVTPAGQGVFVRQAEFRSPVHCCASGSAFTTDLTFLQSLAGTAPGVGVCDAACVPCPSLVSPQVLAADARHALILRLGCQGEGRKPTVVRDLVTGEELTVPVPWSLANAGAKNSGSGNAIAGRYVSGSASTDGVFTGAVVDWTTGDQVQTVEDMRANVVLDDGTLFYNTGSTDRILRLRLGETVPTELQASGEILAVAGGRILARGADQSLSVSFLDGEVIGTYPNWGNRHSFDVRYGFDGTRIAYTEPACMVHRLQLWDLGAERPESPVACAKPRPVGRVRIGPRAAKVRLECPVIKRRGCVGTVVVGRPAHTDSRVNEFALFAGQRSWIWLTRSLSPETCRRLAARRTWRLRFDTGTVSGPTTVSVGRRSNCPARSR